ncbi:MAG: glycogen debranching enzyme, partial [Candidatus Saccharibacteria bacterium]|nr:glycogen debranching enzyme [Candidatus Saccharibacteria bacterium]
MEIPQPKDAQVIPALALRSVTSKSGAGVYASSDTLFKGAVFGRDSLEVAEDLLLIKPRLVRNILLTLGRLQGQEYNTENEEEPGKIIHEYRSTVVDGKPIDDISLSIFRNLSQKWGGDDRTMAYYGSVDATPHFLRTLGMYTNAYGESFLDRKIHQKGDGNVSLREVAQRSSKWLLQKIAVSESGLVEYKRQNPHGIENQVWKDSKEFYVHEDKQRANHDAPIASIEVQGLAYDGLMAAATRFFPDTADTYRNAAHVLRDQTIEHLWQNDRNAFALGLDYDPDGQIRIIRTATANPAALLDTGFFDDLPPKMRQKYVTAIAQDITSGNFLTDAGIRSRSLSEAHLVDHWDYHGSYVSWPKETYDIAKGMRRQGFPKLARQLENRLLNVWLRNRSYPEFVYVDELGRVLAGPPSTHSHGELTIV